MCNKFKPLACGFHSHTAEGSLDGASLVDRKIIYVAEQGRIADCVTDHGLMSALVPHHNAAQKLYKAGKTDKLIKSIHGIELYVIDPHRPPKIVKDTKTKELKEIPEYYHLTVHFKDNIAYQYFCNMTPIMESRGIVKFGELKPLITFEEIEKIAGHITIGSGCLIGAVQKNVMRGRFDLAEKMYKYLRDMAGPGNFFVEAFPHCVDRDWKRPVIDKKSKTVLAKGRFEPITEVRGWEGSDEDKPKIDECSGSIDIQKEPNMFVIQMAKKYGDPVVISLDDHFAAPEDELIQTIRLGNGQENWRFSNVYAAYDSDYCAKMFKKQLGEDIASDRNIEEWIDNSYMFVDKFNDYKMETASDRWLLPSMDMITSKNITSRELFWELANKYDRLPKEGEVGHKEYKDRAEYELSVMIDNGVEDFMPYFYVIEKIASWGRDTGHLVNVRGSAGGSLLLYALGVSILDPIKYKLPFERFLTLGRIKSGSLPDVDLDCQDRSKVIEMITELFGDRVCLISNNNMLKLKSSIKDCERAIKGFVDEKTEIVAKSLKIPTGVHDKDWLFGYNDKVSGEWIQGFFDHPTDSDAEKLRQWAMDNPETWEATLKCIGIPKTKGVHAGGVIIAPKSASNYFPLIKTKQGMATAYDMKGVESVGGVKFDILGVETLNSISTTLKSIREHEGEDITWREFPYDEKVFQDTVFQGKLSGLFQISTKTMAPYVSQIMPKTVEELSAVIALVRPGTLDAPSPDPSDPKTETAATYYIKCARKQRAPYYIHKDLEPILEETHGVVLYQEQTLEIFRTFAGYNYETAEDVRRAIGKKIQEELDKHGRVLVEKLLQRGWTEAQANTLFDTIIASSKYSFNKSHSASYGAVAYNGAYLKSKYPLHYWKGELMSSIDDRDRLASIMDEAKEYLMDIDLEKSHPVEWAICDNKLYPPLTLIKGVGEKGAEALKDYLIKNNIKTFDELLDCVRADKKAKISTGVTSTTVVNLMYSGALDALIAPVRDMSDSKKQLATYKELEKVFYTAIKAKPSEGNKKRGEMIGLSDVFSPPLLGMWRWQANPLSRFSFLEFYQGGLKKRGFVPVTSGSVFSYRRESSPTSSAMWVVDDWSAMFEYSHTDFFRSMMKGITKAVVVGVITDVKIAPYAGGTKERMIVSVYNGRENITDLVVFPKRGENSVSGFYKGSMTVGKFFYLVVKPSLYGDKKSAIIEDIEELFISGVGNIA